MILCSDVLQPRGIQVA